MDASRARPLVALVVGDPAGIGPELSARLAADPEVAERVQLLIVGDRRVFERGAREARLAPAPAPVAEVERPALPTTVHLFLDLANFDPDTIAMGRAVKTGGASALDNFRKALALGAAGQVDAVCFTPFNKGAMRMAYPPYEDEVVFSSEFLGLADQVAEFNVQPKLWSARVTSHVPLAKVASLLSIESIVSRLLLTDRSMRQAGYSAPHIAVAGLNPHGGDGGNFGREEIEVIEPAVKAGQARGIRCSGPYSPDTVFVRARDGEFDAVLTMYHDQGQIAMKLMGFFEGVVYFAGLPFPLTTPAHGTAYEIAGQGKADIGANRAAVLLAGRMARRAGRNAAEKTSTKARESAA
ncbi:MAG TPA: 4-hydroxythreonine-4-phosphate dehydrogenase PdxA [Roseiarcus sp.]|nr:4-hydroxythreonine-4-phosphate dehydrogenase PdxA [Roseiarcus sp.]